MQSPLRRRDERGETLVEVLVALTILGLAALAILAGVQLVTKTSDIHRKATTSGAYVRTFAEAIQQYVGATGTDHYVACAGANAYRINAVMDQFAMPTGYTQANFAQAAAVPVTGVGADASCPGGDAGVQRVLLTVTSPDGKVTESLTVVLRRTCDASTPC